MVLDRHQSDLYVRPSWLDAALALRQIEKGRAEGNRSTLWFRSRLQKELFKLGCFLQRHAGKVLFVAFLVLATFCVGLKSAIVHSKIDQLWVEEGGRLEREVKYAEAALGESSSNTHQLVIQIPKNRPMDLLSHEGLLAHLKIVKAASAVSVHLFNVNWRLKDICYSPSFPSFDMHLVDQIFRDIIPCTIITPLDCFWEGSKLLGPDAPVTVPGIPYKLKWTSLNPQKLLEAVRMYSTQFPINTLEDTMRRAGITTGYQEKPCLNPFDRECPDTAPNKNSSMKLNIAEEFRKNSGCSGFASKYMHWPASLILANNEPSQKSPDKAEALQTVIQLMGERDLYEYYTDDYKVHQIDWTPQKAAQVLEAWQRRFSEEVRRQEKLFGGGMDSYSFYSFSTSSLNDILSQFSKIRVKKIATGYLIVLAYVVLSLFCWKDAIQSQCVVGLAAVFLVAITIAAALGFCAVLGIAFNALTTQVLPYLGLVLGLFDVLLLINAYSNQRHTEHHSHEETGIVLKKAGVSVLLSSFSKMAAFLSAAIIPIPALRVFSLQAAILVLFNLVTTLFVFPALVSIDLRRRRSGRVDILFCCCVMPGEGNWPCCPNGNNEVAVKKERRDMVTCALPPDRNQTITILAPNKSEGNTPLRGLLPPESGKVEKEINKRDKSGLDRYSKWLLNPYVRVIVMIVFFILFLVNLLAATEVKDGLDFSKIVPQGTNEFHFLEAQQKYFGFYNMFAVTEGVFDYPSNQKLLYEYHDAFARISNVVKNDNGGLPTFWLQLFRDWLYGLQKAFDKDWERGCITQERWHANASDDGVLAYKLLVQTGYIENPVDKSLVTQVRLVDSDGIINEDAFYNYLSAWICNDAFAYSSSSANLRPEPKSWCHVANDYELRIPKSSPLIYAQIPFYLQRLSSTSDITQLIAQVRAISEKFEERGLPNFPSGIPFLYWEQYQHIRIYIAYAVLSAFLAVFCIVFLLLFNFWMALLIVFQLAAMLLQVLASFDVMNVKVSAVSGVMLVISAGILVHFCVHLGYGFVTSIGNRQRRVKLALRNTLKVCMNCAVGLLLSMGIFLFSDFNFISREFGYLMLSLFITGVIHNCIFFPVILSLIGPAAEVKPLQYPDRISTPSPEPVRKVVRNNYCNRQSSIPPPRRHKDSEPDRLSTITEEPGSWHSATHEIVVEPEFVVETTTCTSRPPASSLSSYGSNENECSCQSSPTSSHRSIPQSSSSSSSCHVTTKVTAKAKFKVEVHTPVHSSCERSHRYNSRRRDSTSSTASASSTDYSAKHSH